MIYTLTGSDARHFDIDSETGQLETKTVFNYEDPEDIGGTAGDNVYMVVVIVSDSASGGLSARVTVTIEVTDENEAPQFLLGPNNTPVTTVTREVAENAMAGTEIGVPVTATDPDGDTLTYSVSDAVNFVIESDGQLKTLVMLDYETQSSYTITVTATDTQGTDATLATILTTQSLSPSRSQAQTMHRCSLTRTTPTSPNIVNANRMVAENRGGVPVGAPVRATDPDGDSLAYRVTDLPGRNDAASFTIDNTGQLRTTVAGLNFEDEDRPSQPAYMVTVTATDPDGSTDTITVNITVMNVNEAPAFTYDTALNRLYVYEGTSSWPKCH